MPSELEKSILLEEFESPRRKDFVQRSWRPELLMFFLLLTFIVPVAGVSLLQVDRFHAAGVKPALELEETFENGKDYVELLRFVTPYKTPLEAIVDITAYSQLLKALIAIGQPVEFYVAIDTWDSNDTRHHVLYVSNASDSCSSVWTSSGNAWNVSLEVIQFPRFLAMTPITPRTSILLADSTIPNPAFNIGGLDAYDGILQGNQVMLSSAAALHGDPSAKVYACENVEDLKEAANLGSIAQEAEQLVLGMNHVNQSVLDNISATLQDLYLPDLVAPKMIRAKILKTFLETHGLEILLSSNATLTKDMPVYLSGAVTDQKYTPTVFFNMSTKFEPTGFIKEVYNQTHALVNVTKHYCIFSLNSSSLPSLQVPQDKDVISHTMQKLQKVVQLGIQRGQEGRALGKTFVPEALLIVNATADAIQEIVPFGSITTTGPTTNLTGQKVCVVQKNPQGHVFTRHFQPTLVPGERALLHLTVTGHGWAATSQSCGEYCHAVYHLYLNDKNFANVTEWRDDCFLNPGGPAQHGTWYESRNGWCPGSVEPGIYIDITDHLNLSSNSNAFRMDLTVWKNDTKKYSRYNDIDGFVQGDTAMLQTSANVLVYSSEVVLAARAPTRQANLSKAEKALQHGCSDPNRLNIPKVVIGLDDDFLSSPEALAINKNQTFAPYPQGMPFNFEFRAPWFFYNESKEILPGKTSGAKYLPVINGSLVQINTRTVFGDVEPTRFDIDWDQLALRFRLMHPWNLEMDHWDRVGSIGVMIPRMPSLNNVQSHLTEDVADPSKSKYWHMSN